MSLVDPLGSCTEVAARAICHFQAQPNCFPNAEITPLKLVRIASPVSSVNAELGCPPCSINSLMGIRSNHQTRDWCSKDRSWFLPKSVLHPWDFLTACFLQFGVRWTAVYTFIERTKETGAVAIRSNVELMGMSKIVDKGLGFEASFLNNNLQLQNHLCNNVYWLFSVSQHNRVSGVHSQ